MGSTHQETAGLRLWVSGMSKLRGDAGKGLWVMVPELRVAPGAFVAVLGENGSGKSTLLDMLGLILTPDTLDRYQLQVDGLQWSLKGCDAATAAATRRNRIGYALQTGGLLEFLTLRQNIRLAARLAGRKAGEMERLARAFGIHGVLDKRPGKVSGGQRQKAALARVLVQEPAVVLADEPTSSLDAESARALVEQFIGLIRRVGSSVIMVTHQESLVEGVADSCYRFMVEHDSDGSRRSVLHPTVGS